MKKIGTNVGTNTITCTDNVIVNGDVISCVLTSDVASVTVTEVENNILPMTVLPIVTTRGTDVPPGTMCRSPP